jgi:hypothetical protein
LGGSSSFSLEPNIRERNDMIGSPVAHRWGDLRR